MHAVKPAAGLVLLAALGWSEQAPARADPSVNSWTVSCEKLQKMLRDRGSMVIHYRSARTNQPLYQAYVSDARYCDPGETATFARVPVADGKSCPVKRCEKLY